MFCFYDWISKEKHINLTEEDVVNMYVDQAHRDVRNAAIFIKLIEDVPVENWELVDMGCEKTLEEMRRYIPTRPLNQSYSGHDCTTYGKCPSCGKLVQDGWGLTEERCSQCGQILKWK